MTKVLHTADLHLDSPLATIALRNDGLRAAVEIATRVALDRIVEIAIDEGVAAALIVGDLYDGEQRSMKTAAYLLSAFRRLAAADIRVFVIRGNHDAESTITREIAWPDNVHVLNGRGGHVMLTDRIAVHGVSFRDPHAPESLLPKFRPVSGVVNIGMLHTSLGGAAGHDPYAPCSVADLAVAGFDYWALGHVHRRTVHHEAPFIVMPGMPQGRDMGEDGPKSVTLVDVGENGLGIEERPTAALEFRRESIDVSDCQDVADVQETIAARVRGLGGSPATVARLTLTGASALTWQLRRDADLLQAVAAEAAEATVSVWIDRLRVETHLPAAEVTTNAAADEIAGLIAEAARGPGLPAEAAAILSEVLADLPPELRNRWGVDEAAMAETAKRLIGDAADWAAVRMHGTGGA
jgi:DNA repair protein SbcD/Mre11